MTENFICDKGNGGGGGGGEVDFVIQSMEVESAGYNSRGNERVFPSFANLMKLFSIYKFR